MKRWKKVAIGAGIFAAVAVAAVLIFVGFFLPDMAKDIAIKQIFENTGRKMAIKEIVINPFGMTAVIKEPEMKEADGRTTFVSFSSVRASVSMKTLWKRAIILDEVTLTGPYFHIVREGANRYNFSDIQAHMEKRKKKEPQTKKAETKFSVNNISITNGRVKFEDHAVSPKVTHLVEKMELRLPFISTIPYMADTYVTPSFSALINNAPFRVDGAMKPLKDSIEASVAFKLVNAHIPTYHSYVPADLPVTFDSGKASADLVVTYTAYKHRKPDFGIGGKLSLTDFFLRDRLKEPLFALRKGEADIRKADVFGKVFDINSFDLLGFDVWLSRDRNGVWSHKRLTMPKDAAPEEAEKKKEESGPPEKVVARVATTRVRDGKFHFADAKVPGGFKTDVTGISFDLGGYSSEKNMNSPFMLGLQTSKGEDVGAAGDLSSDPLAFNTNVSVKGIRLQNYYPFLAEFITAPIKGTADVFAHVDFDKQANRFRADNISLHLKNTRIPFGTEDYAKLTSFKALDGSFDMEQNRFNLAKLEVAGGDVRISKDKDGNVTVNRLIREKKREGSSVKTTKKKGEKPFGYKVNAISLSGVDFTFRDDSLGTPRPAEFRLRKISAGLENVTGPKFSTMPYRFAAGYGKGGTIKTSGTVLPEPLKVKTHTVIGRIPIRDFEPYFRKNLNVVFLDGLTDANLKADLAKSGGKMTGTFGGDVAVKQLRTRGPLGNDVLVWESLRLDNIDGALEPMKFHVREVVLSEYMANVVIAPDGTLNLQKMVKKEEKPEKKEEKKGPPPDIRIDAVTLYNGVLAFEDQHLKPQVYSTKFVKLGGRISGLSSEPGKRAGIDLRGALENHSPLRISGEMNPLSEPAYANIKVSFDDIELPRLTPYSGTYLGYRINQGKLHLDLQYRVEDKKLDASNRIFIDQLTFGKKVESDKATSLPVPAAVGLLKDRKGEIHLDVPVQGRTDDPSVGIWGVVGQAFKGMFSKLFTNPFGALFGGKDADFRNIYFDYGKWKLAEAETRKLDAIAEKIGERPGLELDVMGFVDKEREPEAYRNQLFLNTLRYEKFVEALKGPKPAPETAQIPESVQVSQQEYGKYLRLAYKRAKFPKPRGSISEEEMKKLMLANIIVDDAQLRELSRLRSLSVRDYLAKKGIAQSRLFLKLGDIYRKAEGVATTNSRVEFGLPTGKTKEKE